MALHTAYSCWTRRQFVRGLGFGGLGFGLSEALQVQATTGVGGFGRARRCLMIFLWGGPSHIDTFDMKPDAPVEYRGEFRPIATSVAGIQWCEHLPRTARHAHHLAVVRSLTQHGRGGQSDHHTDAYYLLTGQQPTPQDRALGINRRPRPDDWPFIGSTVAYCRPVDAAMPAVVALPKIHDEATGYVVPGQSAARLGPAYEPLLVRGTPDARQVRGFLPRDLRTPAFELPADIATDRLAGRHDLLGRLSAWQRGVESRGLPRVWNEHQRRAFGLLTSSRVRRAFDLSHEAEPVRQRYGDNINGQSTLLARRLLEAGVPFVCVHWNSPEVSPIVVHWDTHGDTFLHLKNHLLPTFDLLFSALLDDLQQRGLLDSTLVLVLGEMGRTPKWDDPCVRGTSYQPGRDHWVNCMFALLAGGGIRGGQIHGSSDRIAAYPRESPVYPGDLAATIYHALGIRREQLVHTDRLGRPVHLLDEGEALPLFG
ncbi:MAG: DUF1501 domain-containing protein [Planctomycetes bacterium]|nr:DUF1501 domain-containing protein [Planctomycetota bacterium]